VDPSPGTRTAGTQGTVYAAIGLSKNGWVLGIACSTEIGRAFIGSPVPTSVHSRADWASGLSKIRMVVCYEAGSDALWPAGSLADLGIECPVLDLASIQLIAGRVV
jgi:hypothetical protein